MSNSPTYLLKTMSTLKGKVWYPIFQNSFLFTVIDKTTDLLVNFHLNYWHLIAVTETPHQSAYLRNSSRGLCSSMFVGTF